MAWAWAMLLILVVAEGVRADDNQLNAIIDEVIYEQAASLLKKGMDKIQIPDISKSFEVKILDHMRVQANISNGLFWNTTSLVRIGDANEIDAPDGTTTFSLGLGLKVAVAEFDFKYRVGFLHGEKRVHLECGDNEVFTQVSLKYDDAGKCQVTLNVLEFKSLGKFKVVLDPPTIMDRLESHLISFTTNRLAGVIKNKINKVMGPLAEEYLEKVDVCSLLPF